MTLALGTSISAHAQTYSRTEEITYHDNLSIWVLGQVQSVKVGNVVLSRTDYDANAMPWKIYGTGSLTAPDLVQRILTYNTTATVESGQRGTLETVTDGRGNTTAASSWKRGVPQSVTYPGASASALVNDDGWIRSVTDERGNITLYDYDEMGRLKLLDYPDGDAVAWASTTTTFTQVATETEYGIAPGHWKQTVTTGNQRKTTYFDGLWRPLIEREEDLSDPTTIRVIAKRYDHEGHVTDAYYPQTSAYTSHGQFSKGVHTKYDALGRVVEVAQDAENGQVLTTTTQYLPGFEMLVTSPRRVGSTRTRFAALDAPTFDYPVKQFLPEGVEVTIARDAFFNPIQLTRAGTDGTSVDRFYFYDTHMRLCRLFEPETGSTVTDYDPAGNVAWTAIVNGFWGEGCHREDVADANRIKRTYDTRNRLTYVDYPVGTDDQTTGYEDTGEVKLARMGGSEWRYTRNKRGLVEQEVLTMDGESRALNYTYTAEGHLASVKYPRGRTIAYAPNALGQPRQAGSYVTSVQYWPDGDVKSMHYANGIAFSASKNERGLPSNRTYASASGALLYSQDLAYDANANLTGVADLAANGPTRNKAMTYDSLDRLKTANAPGLWGVESYTYDAQDNIRSRIKDGQTYDYVYDGLNRLRELKIGATTVKGYWYDLAGNVSCRSVDGCINGGGLTFDLANRLQTYEGVQSNQYDAWGRRIRKTDLHNGAETQSLYSQSGQLMVEHDSAANTISDYVYLGSTMVAKVSDTLPLLVAPATSGGGFALTWPSGSAVRYVVEESADFGAWTAVYDGAALTWSASGRAPGTYRYRIKACTAEGVCTTYTSAVTVKVMPDLTPIIYELLLN
jgi:YD repeat-containing protein